MSDDIWVIIQITTKSIWVVFQLFGQLFYILWAFEELKVSYKMLNSA